MVSTGLSVLGLTMSHSAPNSANISAPFADTPKTPVEEIKARFDGPMRNLLDSIRRYMACRY